MLRVLGLVSGFRVRGTGPQTGVPTFCNGGFCRGHLQTAYCFGQEVP